MFPRGSSRIAGTGDFLVNQRDPGTAAMLSIIPGLGQFYNGEGRKGLLFMDVWLLNMALLTVAAFAVPLVKLIQQFGTAFNFKANAALLASLEGLRFGTAPFAVLSLLVVSFVLYAVRDAHDTASSKRRRTLYRASVVELSEAASGSYLVHGAAMVALAVMAMFFLIPREPVRQVTEIEFLPSPDKKVEKPVKPTNVKSQHATRAGGKPKLKSPSMPSMAAKPVQQQQHSERATAPSQPKPTPPKPTVRETSQAPAPPKPVVQKAEFPQPVAPKPALPQPVAQPTPRPAAPSPAAPAAPPRPVQKIAMAAPTPTFTPRAATSGVQAPAPTPMPNGTMPAAGVPNAPAPTAAARQASGSGTPQPAPARTASSSSGSGFNAPAPQAVTPGGGTNSHTPSPVLPGAPSSIGSSNGPSSPSMTPRKSTSTGSSPGQLASVKPAVSADFGGKTADAMREPGVGATPLPDFSQYMANLERRIRRAWYPSKAPQTRSTSVYFRISRNGEMSGLRIDRSSGDAQADKAALAAVSNAAPFAPLPAHADESVEIQFTFDYKVFAGRGY